MNSPAARFPVSAYDAIVIGGSAGGIEALNVLLPAIPAQMRAAVIIVLHLTPHSDSILPILFQEKCAFKTKEADEKETIQSGTVYFAPANYHLLVEEDRTLSLSVGELVNYSRPSIDVLFESAALGYGNRLAGIVLTGANQDGAAGLAAIVKAGGLGIVQDPESARFPAMPQAALDRVQPCLKMNLAEIADWLTGHAQDRGSHG